MAKKGWHQAEVKTSHELEGVPVPIANDAAIATTEVKGRAFIPLLILDTRKRQDIENLITAHKATHQGECTSRWGRHSDKDQGPIILLLQFSRPAICTVLLHLDPLGSGGTIDQIIDSEAVYLMPGKPGDRLIHDLGRNKILVQVPSSEFSSEWNRILQKTLQDEGRRKGLSRTDAKQYSSGVIKSWRKFAASARIGR
jgi:hypothetical protein